ncbi:TPA: hypothetical protein ACP32N_003254 [Pseudomonas aeruginosa]
MTTKAEKDNNSNQRNKNNIAYWRSRGYDKRPDDWKVRESDKKP